VPLYFHQYEFFNLALILRASRKEVLYAESHYGQSIRF
jgi:hypothetical protein